MIESLLHNSFLLYAVIAGVTIVILLVLYLLFRAKKSPQQELGKQVYVGNLSYRVREQHLRDFFSHYGDISQLRIIKNHNTGRSKGFGFVTFASSAGAENALDSHGKNFEGRALVVHLAKPR